MISRKALIIASSEVTPRLPGVKEDVKSIRSFLLSAGGGAWEDPEIEILLNSRKFDIERSLKLCRYTDYVLITCSGHGEHQIGNQIDSTLMYLTETETMHINEINPGNSRHLIIADVCRKLVPVSMQKSYSAFAESRVQRAEVNKAEARSFYDSAIASCSEGRIVAYSCEKNQSAGDDGTGGVFTQELLKAPVELEDANKIQGRVVNIYDAFQRAKAGTYASNSPQTPVLDSGRRRDFYPFGITRQQRQW